MEISKSQLDSSTSFLPSKVLYFAHPNFFDESRSVDQLRLRPFYIIRVSMHPIIFCRCMSCTPIEVKIIVTIVTSNLISHIMILLAFIIITGLVYNFFVFCIRACCYVRKVALRAGDGKIIQCSNSSILFQNNQGITPLQIPNKHCNLDMSILHTETCFPYLPFHRGSPFLGQRILSYIQDTLSC